ncbi:MAG TPA: ISKra4 family transposase [Edaphobacter sp.]|nr:ISKra4 family transposase [Edaphobacter sp.]
MKLRLQLVVESDNGETVVTGDVAQWERHSFRPEEVGLTLAEAKQMLGCIQRTMVQEQVAEYTAEQSRCRDCGRRLAHKGQHEIIFRTLFGELRLPSPRLYSCSCRQAARASFSPLAQQLPERTAPELVYLETKFAALLSYGLTVKVLSEILPIGDPLNTRSVRRQMWRSAERMESELGEEQWAFIDGCQRDWNHLPAPDPPLTVGLDGGFVHAKDQPTRAAGWFEVIVGKSMPAEGEGKCLAFVQTYDQKPKRRLFELLRNQHMQMNQQITFLTDGGEDIRDLPQFINPEAEHILDWFHIAMRLTVMGQMAKGLCVKPRLNEDDDAPETLDIGRIGKSLERLKWYLWHGNVYQALKRIEYLEWDLEDWEDDNEPAAKLLVVVEQFRQYIEVNQNAIPNYGDRYRHGETISTSFVESAVNQVISKRMVKLQQMRWTKRGGHLLLQVRTRVLNDDLRNTFRNWYPGLALDKEEQLVA